ncbi:MAG: hypothetical protein J5851_08890 [Oscillospiraceae bacterium]|nr:hypothetical protein [Oscillospiraceae bacterium]
MLLSEFQNHTDIFPDAITYEEIEREYMDERWESKAQFCAAYKFNEGGLAEKIQRAANDRLIELGEGTAQQQKTRAKMAATIKALTEELEWLEAAYDKALHDMLSPSLCSMIQQRVREILR